jgi:hypothetical protein
MKDYNVAYKIVDLDSVLKHIQETEYLFKHNNEYLRSHIIYVGKDYFIVRHNFKHIKNV